jgi:hypothetical protein
MTFSSRTCLWIALCGSLLLSGCAIVPASGRPDSGIGKSPFSLFQSEASDGDLPELLSFYRETAAWPDGLIETEHSALQREAAESHCGTSRLKLGLVLLRAAERGIKVETSALDLLKPCLAEPAGGVGGLAHLIDVQLRESVAGQNRLRAGVQELEVTRKENQELKRQLEGLKAIERSLQDRRRR